MIINFKFKMPVKIGKPKFHLNINKLLLLLSVFSFLPAIIFGQKGLSFKDSLDHKLDLSDWVVSYSGFIPVPYLITEPALGGIGGALLPVFIKPNSPYLDTIHGQQVKTRAKPNIYAIGGAYTANGTWLVAGGAAGTIKKWRANYRIGLGYANVNMEFYKEVQSGDEISFEFNMKTIPIFGQFTKQIGKSSWSTGLNYLFLKTELIRTNAEFHTPKEVNSNVSRLGLLVEYDSRDNLYTPDKGFRWITTLASSAEFIGSDYGFTSATSVAYWYVPVSKRIISGYRAEYQQIWGDPPFYMKPFILMRGIPIMRYQGNITALAETEWRWDLTKRHSLVTFGGAAKAIGEGESFGESSWRVAGGAGWRYLIARKLKLRMGIDIARGPEEWAYYIVFGTNWIR
jgi:hypothetical protein